MKKENTFRSGGKAKYLNDKYKKSCVANLIQDQILNPFHRQQFPELQRKEMNTFTQISPHDVNEIQPTQLRPTQIEQNLIPQSEIRHQGNQQHVFSASFMNQTKQEFVAALKQIDHPAIQNLIKDPNVVDSISFQSLSGVVRTIVDENICMNRTIESLTAQLEASHNYQLEGLCIVRL